MLAFTLLLPTVSCNVPRFATSVTLRLFSLELGVLSWFEVPSTSVLISFLLLSSLGGKCYLFLLFLREDGILPCFFLDAFG